MIHSDRSSARIEYVSLALALATGCGRVGFEPAAGDALTPDVDVDVEASMLVWLPFEPTQLVRDAVTGIDAQCSTSCPQAAVLGARPAARFTGTECLQIPSRPALQAMPITISAWFAHDGTANGSLVGKAYSAATQTWNSWELFSLSTSVDPQYFNGAMNLGAATVPFTPGAVHHLAVSYADGDVTVYYDGVLRPTVDEAFVTVFDDEPVRIGCDRDIGTLVTFYEGILADVRVYSVVLSASEIAALAVP